MDKTLAKVMRDINDLENDIYKVEDNLLRCKNYQKEEYYRVRLTKMRRSLSKLNMEKLRLEL